MVVCDKWVAVKIFEVIFCISCVVCKRVTDDEAVRVSLYLQKLSREWSLLRNVTWTAIGASFGDAVYGGYVIITFGLLLGRIFREVPKGRRILEGFLLGMGGLELASLDSVPDNLIDNAAVLGVLSLVTAALFLIDLAGPRGKSTSKHSQTEKQDAEKNTFSYPSLPLDSNVSTKTEKNDKNTLQKPKFFPEKFKKVNKKEQKVNKTNHTNEITKIQDINEHDDVDTFIPPENDDGENTIETIEKSKYGSVRNGNSKLSEAEVFQKMSPEYNQDEYRGQSDKIGRTPFDHHHYNEEMIKNMEYLKVLDEKNKELKSDSKYYSEESSSLNNQYSRDYKKNIAMQTDHDKRNYPRMGLSSHTDNEKQRHWETFEEESLPPFPVREDYLPEVQTPIFARIKESKNQKTYNIYDNYNHNNVSNANKRTESSQTDSLRSKTSTLRSKPPTLQQIAEYFGLEQKKINKSDKKETASQVDRDEIPAVSFLLPMPAIREAKEHSDFNREPISPTDPGYVQYTAQNWNERLHRQYSSRTPRHSPTDE
ncbi:uncharacterized protein LOC143919895 isoform X2 [Arctopsyche grandis]|uniref:uncharacterized protein LOC143919895 isoform X2 n=1 Tax=Arctopsyche grandis TaxID=121162 RepID=UPI00406D8E3A